jgi:DNA topoisomerase I
MPIRATLPAIRRTARTVRRPAERSRRRPLFPPPRPRRSPSQPDSQAFADAAGLHYTIEGKPGISRRRSGRGWAYRGPDGERITDKATLARIRALVIPPAWREVWIDPDPQGHIQATGRDQKGRKQYRYHPRWREIRDETKFGRMIAFAATLPAIRARVAADLGSRGLPRDKTLAAVVALLDRSLIRIGNAEYARTNETFGLTTLHATHAAVRGSDVRFVFRGKAGKMHEVGVRDRRLARIIGQMQDLPGEPLFQYVNGDGTPNPIDSADVNAYLREAAGEEFTAKDFRTWGGTVLAAKSLRRSGPASTRTAVKGNILQAIDQTAERLGNTRAVCRASYIHPEVLSGYESGALVVFDPGPSEISDLNDDEWFALAWLRHCEESGESGAEA